MENSLFPVQTGHETVQVCMDPATGLRAIIAVHDTRLGPALGGVRMWNYATEEEAQVDVLRLARGMTYKAAAAGLNLGGGKAVIIGDSRREKSDALLRRFGQFVELLGGCYITAEDVGIGTRDISIIGETTSHVAGLAGQSGDPSPFTAYGTFLSIKAGLKRATGSEELSGRKVMVQGTGHVGLALVRLLRKEGAVVFAHDVRDDSLRDAVVAGARLATAAEVYSRPVDVYAPCALGATLNPETIPLLRCKVVAGAANNQLLDEDRDGLALQKRDIVYVPDFVANAGGIINISVEREGGYDRNRALQLTENIRHNVNRVFEIADAEGLLPHQAAMRLAEIRLNRGPHALAMPVHGTTVV
ncbi:Glu/Leu/Phe/Val dehydrogenase dimerization domain-containing protein [Verrucomicrobium sp. BvORR034]|uniref:Glu/Leu/Phe/Val family dehydrogenase n=1 Tax=Verrucomicrobium sp. BvORR034 TaxID=1396418 RepID=UPI000679D883|nr:Glu/Leu/Phe/Val dehydrogenase dimerization domain-containing protein [Verrucomicrobium sp. BvORR034]